MDKIAVISDIHGNIPALKAVFSDIRDRGISRIICLGDLAGKGPESEAAVDMIKENCEAVVKGNWDHLISIRYEGVAFQWHHDKLGSRRIEYLKKLPTYIQFYMSGRLVRLCHAAPHSVFHRVGAAADIEEKVKLFAAPEGEKMNSDIIGYGDIHQAYIQNLKSKMAFNVGSVGNPLDLNQASYGIIEGRYNSKTISSLSVNLVRIPYDIEQSITAALVSGMPDLDAYINELRTAKYRGSK